MAEIEMLDEVIQTNILSKFGTYVEKLKNIAEYEKDRNKLLDDWADTLTHNNLYNKLGCTFEIIEESQTAYGWYFKILPPKGKKWADLINLEEELKTSIGCAYLLIDIHESNKFAWAKIIYSEKLKINQEPFIPVKVKPWEWYIGDDVSGKPIIIDSIKTPHGFWAGATRKGKNGSINQALVSLIHSCSPSELMIYFYQAAKGDGAFFEDVEHVYAYAQDDIDKLLIMVQHLKKVMDYRTKLFSNMTKNFKGDNLLFYNKANPNNQLPFILLVIDEFIAIMPETVDEPDVKKKKNQIIDLLNKIAQYGGSFGISYMVAHQKPVKDLCPPFLKNMSSAKICFGYSTDGICSEVVLGSGDTGAVGLPPRRAICRVDDMRTLIFTRNNDGVFEKYLKPHFKPNRRTLFRDLELSKKNYGEIKEKSTIIGNMRKVETPTPQPSKASNVRKVPPKDKEIKSNTTPKNKEQILINTMKNNPNYVPYNDYEKDLLIKVKKGEI